MTKQQFLTNFSTNTALLRFPKSIFGFFLISSLANLFPLSLGALIGLLFGNVSEENRRFTAEQLFSHNFGLGMLMALGGWFSCGFITLLIAVFSSLISGFGIGANISEYGYLYVTGRLPHFFPEILGFIGFTVFGLSCIIVILDFIYARMTQEKFRTLAVWLITVLAASTVLLNVAAILEERVLL